MFGQRVKGVGGVGDGELGGVGVIRLVGGSGVDDSGVAGDVFPGEPVGSTFGGGGFEVVQVPGGFLGFNEQGVDVVEKPRHLRVTRRSGDVLSVAGEIADHFVAAVDSNGGEVVVKAGQPALSVGEQPSLKEFRDVAALAFECVHAEPHKPSHRLQ